MGTSSRQCLWGLRVGATAMNALGVELAKDGQLIVLVDVGDDHCANCYADGLQVILGTTFGKGNIKTTHKGKCAVTVIDKATGLAVWVTPKTEIMLANKQTLFFKDYRKEGISTIKLPDLGVDPLINKVMNAPDDKLINISEVFQHNLKEHPHSFSSFVSRRQKCVY